jgi:hypothetical protein
VRDISLPITPETVWRALREAGANDCLVENRSITITASLADRANVMNEKTADIANRIADQLASCGVKLVASLSPTTG